MASIERKFQYNCNCNVGYIKLISYRHKLHTDTYSALNCTLIRSCILVLIYVYMYIYIQIQKLFQLICINACSIAMETVCVYSFTIALWIVVCKWIDNISQMTSCTRNEKMKYTFDMITFIQIVYHQQTSRTWSSCKSKNICLIQRWYFELSHRVKTLSRVLWCNSCSLQS